MFPHDHPWLDEEPELMPESAKEMEEFLEKVIQQPYNKKKDKEGKTEAPPLIENIHAYMFVYDSSNKKTFQSMMCMIETISELEKANKKGGGTKSGKKELPAFFPRKIVVGNKKDLRKNREFGVIE